jgi:Cyclophilin type peptidyl-prolyl cis-trans isomerase/CLD
MTSLIALAAAALAAPVRAAAPPPAPLPSDPLPADWRAIPGDEVMIVTLATGKQVVIRLAPGHAPAHVANIRALARAKWWDGTSVYRVQENWVTQWGDATEKKPLPAGITDRPAAEFEIAAFQPAVRMRRADSYSTASGITADGWPVATDGKAAWLTHCYGMVGAAAGPQLYGRRADRRRHAISVGPAAQRCGDGHVRQGERARADCFGAAGQRPARRGPAAFPVSRRGQHTLRRRGGAAGESATAAGVAGRGGGVRRASRGAPGALRGGTSRGAGSAGWGEAGQGRLAGTKSPYSRHA